MQKMKLDRKDVLALFIALAIYLGFHLVLLAIVLSFSVGITFTILNYIKGESVRGSLIWIIFGLLLLPIGYYLYRIIRE
ncbi:MAG TPA: hypothetical protein EYP68_03550 [Candidatus Korarchaeota archaeon]|nr:hypothetical protein [Candidatus Korarchaeota archaeon]